MLAHFIGKNTAQQIIWCADVSVCYYALPYGLQNVLILIHCSYYIFKA